MGVLDEIDRLGLCPLFVLGFIRVFYGGNRPWKKSKFLAYLCFKERADCFKTGVGVGDLLGKKAEDERKGDCS